jgi:tripartite ATP-independent transporter DctM subunit
VGFFGAFLASARDRHLSIAVGEAFRSSTWKRRLDVLSRAGTIGILACLTVASAQHVHVGIVLGYGDLGGWLPLWIAIAPMTVAFASMAVATFWRRGEEWRVRALILPLAFLVGPVLIFLPLGDGSVIRIVGIIVLGLLAAVGMPLFAALGGAALLLYFLQGGPVTGIVDATYQIVSEPILPSIPLFALAGVVLARGGSPERLIRLVRALTGWIPGGASIAAILGCAFFTALTGASGVTILALGGLLLPVLLAAHHKERFSLGLLTASGSVGLLFLPSVPLIFYAVKGKIPINELAYAGFLPGLLLLFLLAGFSVYQVKDRWTERPPFELREAIAAVRTACGDILLPVLVIVALLGGFMTPVETAAFAALLAITLETGIHRTMEVRQSLPAAFVETTFLVGALIAVIGLAFGLSWVFVDAQIPDRVTLWVTSIIESKWVFLLVLNLLLLAVGALMDIFSAIIIVVPLIAAVAPSYGIAPAHLGIVFLANLELGYLTPPVGMNLFLSSLTFDRPLLKVWRASLPFLAIFAGWVVLVTYVPWLSEGFANLIMGK